MQRKISFITSSSSTTSGDFFGEPFAVKNDDA